MVNELQIIRYPDPRLKKNSAEIADFDAALHDLANRMLELMREHKGVGLAAPQVGINIRLFVMNPTGEPPDQRIYINPELIILPDGEETTEEGCLSLPGVTADITRHRTVTLKAKDLAGNPVELTESGYLARIWQHEIDHLNGVLITDRMGMTAKMMHRRTLRELEEKYAAEHPAPPATKGRRARARR